MITALTTGSLAPSLVGLAISYALSVSLQFQIIENQKGIVGSQFRKTKLKGGLTSQLETIFSPIQLMSIFIPYYSSRYKAYK